MKVTYIKTDQEKRSYEKRRDFISLDHYSVHAIDEFGMVIANLDGSPVDINKGGDFKIIERVILILPI